MIRVLQALYRKRKASDDPDYSLGILVLLRRLYTINTLNSKRSLICPTKNTSYMSVDPLICIYLSLVV